MELLRRGTRGFAQWTRSRPPRSPICSYASDSASADVTTSRIGAGGSAGHRERGELLRRDDPDRLLAGSAASASLSVTMTHAARVWPRFALGSDCAATRTGSRGELTFRLVRLPCVPYREPGLLRQLLRPRAGRSSAGQKRNTRPGVTLDEDPERVAATSGGEAMKPRRRHAIVQGVAVLDTGRRAVT